MYNALGIWYTSNNPAELNARSFANTILRLFPNGRAPIYALTGEANRGTAVAVEHGYFTKTYQTPTVNLDTAVADGVATAFDVDTTVGIVPGMVLQSGDTRENVLVVSVDSATQLTVQRGFGEVVAAAIADETDLFYVGTAYAQASERPVELSVPAVYVPNYTQIFRNSWALSGTAAASATEADWDSVSENRMDCMAFHSQGIESAILFGQAVQPTGTPPIHATRGIEQAIWTYAAGNVEAAPGATTTYEQLRTYLEPAFQYSSSQSDPMVRTAWTDNVGARVLTDIGRIESNLSIADRTVKVFGMTFNKMEIDDGTLMWKTHPLLRVNGAPKGRLIVTDLPSLRIAYMKGRDVITERYFGAKDSTGNGKDAIGGGLLSELAVEYKNPIGSALVYDLVAAA